MITILAFLVLLLCVATWRHAGPLRALLIAWLVCLTPVATGIVTYDYLVYATSYYAWVLAASIAAFAGGALLTRWMAPSVGTGRDPDQRDADLNRRERGCACC